MTSASFNTISTAKPEAHLPPIDEKDEKRKDILVPAFQMISMIVSAPFTYLKSIFTEGVVFYNKLTNPTKFIQKYFPNARKIERASLNQINSRLVDNARLLHVIERCEFLTQQMGIKKEVQLYLKTDEVSPLSSETSFFDAGAMGFPRREIGLLIIHPNFCNLPNDMLDFTLAHELTHIKYRDDEKRTVMYFIAHAVCLITFPLIFIVYPMYLYLNSKASQKREYRADLTAMKTLCSNQGGINFLLHANQTHRILKERMVTDKISSKGESRLLFNAHPPVYKRLEAALAFKG